MRAIWVAGIGGLVVGHILWLAGISAAIASSDRPKWVLVIAAISVLASIAAGMLGWRQWKLQTRSGEAWAAFLWTLTVSPLLLSLTVLGMTYL
ncbi:MAG: hypothetical protein K0U80_00785 [Actinomycetia bacterium]|nr:hypothetical protein [Actinomycetes bacterium]